jgi:chaperone required for assembly of F1-ATPase
MTTASARRFYKHVTASSADAGLFAIMLDERVLRSPQGMRVCVPTRALAEAVAKEWDAQAGRIEPRTMPLTQLAFAALDGGPHARAERVAFISAFAETDLCCHRAEGPIELATAQDRAWGPLLSWLEGDLGVSLPVVRGVIPAPSHDAVRAIADHARELDDFFLTGLAHATGLTGSVVIALSLARGRIAAAEAFTAATIDEAWNMQHWGRDSEAEARLARLCADLEAVARYLEALRRD